MNELKVLKLTLLDGLKIRDPFNRARDHIGYVNPPKEEEEVPVEWLSRGILVGGCQFLPYGTFTAEVEKRVAVEEPLSEPAESPEPAAEAEDPSEAPAAPQKAPTVEKKHFRSRQGRK